MNSFKISANKSSSIVRKQRRRLLRSAVLVSGKTSGSLAIVIKEHHQRHPMNG